jgi:hypothetical protein
MKPPAHPAWRRLLLLCLPCWLICCAASNAFAQANDNFINATVLSDVTGSDNGSNTTATKEVGEPAHAGNTGGHSVWYSWTASSTTPVTFETIGSSFDTLLAVYTGATLPTLSQVASNNDIFATNRWSRVRFTPAVGVTYRIAVDGNNGATGDIYLHWIQRQSLPDLTVWGPSLNPAISVESFSTSSCAVVEGLIQPGLRKIVRFATESRNGGAADLHMGSPVGNPLFEYSSCHGHYHFHDYVDQRLKNGATVVATGLKVAHCLTDSIRWDSGANASSVYNCTDQGIQVGWADIYRASLDGQWIDVTGVPAGSYTLELEVNPDRIIEEANYSNNITQLTLQITDGPNIYLPAPIYLETFDAVSEGSMPPGWSVTNFTTAQTPGYDLADPLSDTYKDFVVISSNRLATVFGTDRLSMPPLSVNGRALTSLATGNLAYANSDMRANSPSSQVNIMFSPDYNLSGKSNVFLSFHSLYEQNQDSIGALEYSIDHGTNWLPVIYMIDNDDIVRDAGGNIDAVVTLNTARADQAYGLAYGAFIAAPLSSALAPFISGRVNDDQVESKRVEVFRLPSADNRPSVRFRFLQTGSCSWYWGIDDLGLYSIPPYPPRFLSVVRNGNNIVLTWNEDLDLLQKNTDGTVLGWTDVPGTVGTSSFSEPIAPGRTLYRLVRQ